ncbi:MAG: hypothetical protein ACLUDU_00490 [Butyricimonas faecihominis]
MTTTGRLRVPLTGKLSEPLETLKHRDEITSIEWPEGVRYRIKHYITGIICISRSPGATNGLTLRVNCVSGRDNHDDQASCCKPYVAISKGRFIPIGDKEYLSLTQTLKRRLEELESMSVEENNRFRIQQFASLFLTTGKKKNSINHG